MNYKDNVYNVCRKMYVESDTRNFYIEEIGFELLILFA